jgi:hypothetical protein
MGFFDMFRKKQKSKNEITNIELKEVIANTALSTMTPGEYYDSLQGLSVEFGYLFTIENHGIEALFKIVTDKSTFYFAAQKNSISQLNFNEEEFKEATEQFLRMHS